jgi:hypothetical protein
MSKNNNNNQYQKYEMVAGKPDTAHVEIFKFSTIPTDQELFPHELEALNAIKQHKLAKFFNDRFLMGCLFSRKLDIERTIKMLKSNLKWRMSNNFEKIPRWSEIDKTPLRANFAITIPGARSKEGHAILYCKLGRLVPSELGKNYLRTIVEFIIWNNSIGTYLDGLDYHRNGLIFIADLQGVGWKNVDISLQRKVNTALMDNFPLRISKVLIINPPGIMTAVMSCAKIFVKKKIMDRIQIVQKEQILDHIDADQLWTEFGGDVEYTVDNLIDTITQRLEESPLRLHTITKNNKKLKKSKKTKEKEYEIDHNNEDIDEDHLKKPKKTSKRKKSTENNLDGINTTDIPPEVLEQLKNNPDQTSDNSDEETNSFLEKIVDKSEEESIRNSNNTKKSTKKDKQ